MADRTCRPDPDLKRLWRMLLPGMSFPACGLPLDANAAAAEPGAADNEAGDEVRPIGRAAPWRRWSGGDR